MEVREESADTMSGTGTSQRPSTEDQRKAAEGWLNSEGFPLEMRVAKTFWDNGFLNVLQGEYYSDPDTGEPRESDIQTVDVIDSGWAGIPIFVCYIVECVYTENPWVVFPISPQSPLLRGQPLPPILSEAAKHLHEAALTLSMESATVPLRITTLPEPIGYALRTKEKAKTGKGDAAYRKTAELLAATEARLNEANQTRRWEMLVPTIVLDGELFAAQLDANGRIAVSLTQGVATVLSGVPSIPIRVVTESALKSFCQNQRISINDLSSRAKLFVERSVTIGNQAAIARFK